MLGDGVWRCSGVNYAGFLLGSAELGFVWSGCFCCGLMEGVCGGWFLLLLRLAWSVGLCGVSLWSSFLCVQLLMTCFDLYKSVRACGLRVARCRSIFLLGSIRGVS